MPPTPIIRARRRRDLGLTELATLITRLAPEIELGWNHLLDELRDAGWPTRTPEDDRHPRRSRPSSAAEHAEPSSLDYADPTGELAALFHNRQGDIDSLNEHLQVILTSLRALHLIATRHRPASSTAQPGCIIANCDEPVESRVLPGGTVTYIGMEQIAGCWVAKIGATPTCRRHRKRRQQDSAA